MKTPRSRKSASSGTLAGVKRWGGYYLLALPALLYLLINNYIPMLGLQIAFKRYNYSLGMWESPLNGFKNFEFLFRTNDAWIMIRNTLGYNMFWIVLNIFIGLLFAILVNEILNKVFKGLTQTIVLLPYLMSMVVISYLVYAYLAPETGFITNLVEKITGHSINFYMEKEYWPFILTFVNQWKNLGFNMLLFLSSVAGIDRSLYESATIDGATRLQQHLSITLPLLKPTAITLFIMNMGMIFRSDFGLFYQVPMNQGALFPVTQTIDTYVYRALMQTSNLGLSSAASFLQSIVGFIFVMVANKIVAKLDPDNAMF